MKHLRQWMKKALAYTLVATLMVPTLAGLVPMQANAEQNQESNLILDENTVSFADVKESGWEYPFVKAAYDNKLMSGKSKDENGLIIFDPGSFMTRAEFVQTLYNKEGKEEVTYIARFTDVPDNQWYTDAILWAAENSIVAGKGDKFDVSGKITREEMATILYKYATNYKGYETAGRAEFTGYTDASEISNWATENMKWALHYGIMKGKKETLAPKDNATRAECAAMLSNFMKAYDMPVTPVEVISITLDKTVKTLNLYEQLTLTATVLPANAADKTISWESSDATIVSVSKGGTICAVKEGTATITAKTKNGKSASCAVTVQAKVKLADSTNKINPVDPEFLFNAPYISTYYFNPKTSANEDIKIPLYITDYEQSEFLNNDTTGKLDLIYEVDGEKKTLKDLPLGDYTLNIGKLSKGLHTFSVQALDKRTGVKSHELYNELWVVDPDEYTISEADTYYMTEQDLASYKIHNNDSTNATDLINTRDGLTKLFADKQAEGYRKIVLLKGTYRINGENARDNCITIPSYFTVDMNESTFKLNTISAETSGCIVLMNNVIDARLENGILEGDRYERQELNLERDGLGEGINTVLIRGGKYCSLNNLTIKNTTGHTIWSLPDMDIGLQRKLKGYTRTAIIDGKEVQCNNYSTSSMMDLSDYINWDANEDYFYIGYPAGYRGIRTKSAIVYVSFYDKNQSFLETVTGCQFRKILIPGNAKYARVTLNDTNISEDESQEGIYIYPRRLGDYHEIKNIDFENTRTCALAPTTCSNLLIEGVTYTNCGDSITPLPVDFEDGWDETQDVYYRNNEVISKAAHTTGTIVDNAGYNHVFENCINHQLTINARLTGCVIRNMNDVRNTVRCDLGDRISNSYARVYDNNCGSINYIIKDKNGVAIADLSVLDETELAKLVNVKVKNCIIQNGTYAGSTHCFGYAEKVTYDNCTFTSFAGRNAVFRNCTIQPASYMNNKLYFYDCTFKALDGSEKITLNLNAPRDSERIFENCKFEGKVTIGTENFHTGIFRNCEFDDVEFITAVDSLDGVIMFENCKINSSAENVIYTGPFAGNIDYINVQFKDCEITHTGENLVGFFSMPAKDSQILFENCTINKNSGTLVKWLTNYSRPQNVDKISVDVIFRNTEYNASLEIDNSVDVEHARITFE